MSRFIWLAMVAIMAQNAFSQTVIDESAVSSSAPSVTASAVGDATLGAPEFVPMTASERARRYLNSTFGPGAILRAVAAGGIGQTTKTPKEWGVGAEAYGDRVGNVLATHIIREALEFGATAALHEDNRYFRSTEAGFLKRSKHAIGSVFITHNPAGGEHLAFSRLSAVAGAAFVSRLWQPRSTNGAGDAAVNFGLTMASDIGWNFVREFCPLSRIRLLRIH